MGFVDFLEALSRLALIVYNPKKIGRNFSICIVRFLHTHLSETAMEHGRKGRLSAVARNYLRKKDSKEESPYINDFEEKDRQKAIAQVMSHELHNKKDAS